MENKKKGKESNRLKIVFFCGVLEPGHDGVGDYTRQLAGEIMKQGHSGMLIALQDRYVQEIVQETYFVEEKELTVMRVPAELPWEEKIELLKDAVKKYNPDWLSLQYVSFAFDEKGLPIRFASRLKMIGGNKKWHVMFHELWVGMAVESSRKEIIWGVAQRHLTNYLLKVLNPVVIHTHNLLYKKQLDKFRVKSKLLPLPTNIPVYHPEKVKEKIENWEVKSDTIDLVIFGNIHEGAPVKQFAKEAAQYQKSHQVKFTLVIIGKKSEQQDLWTKEWKASGMKVTLLGQLSEQEVSETLAGIRFGIFTTPLVLVDKSSTVSTMKAHGVHLICVSRKWTPKGISIPPDPLGPIQYKEGKLAEFLERIPDFSTSLSPAEVAERFISNLLKTK